MDLNKLFIKRKWLRLMLVLSIFTSCAKSEIDDDISGKNEFKIATFTTSGLNSMMFSFEYYPNGRIKKYLIPLVREDVYEYSDDSIVCTMYNLNPRYGIVSQPIYTIIYKINSKGLAISSTTIHSDNSRSQTIFEYDSNDFLTKIGSRERKITNSNLTYAVDSSEFGLLWSKSYEYFEDVNNTNSDLFSSGDLTNTGIDFLGKRGKNLLKKYIVTSIPDNPEVHEFSYTYDTKGRIVERIDSYYGSKDIITYFD